MIYNFYNDLIFPPQELVQAVLTRGHFVMFDGSFMNCIYYTSTSFSGGKEIEYFMAWSSEA